MPGPADNGGEDSPGGVISGKSGFAHTGSVVNNKGSNFVVTHGGLSAKRRKVRLFFIIICTFIPQIC